MQKICSFLCVYICVPLSRCANKHVMCICGGQRLTLGVFLCCFLLILWDSVPHWDVIRTDSASVAGPEASGIVLCLLPQWWNHKPMQSVIITSFYVGPRELNLLMLTRQALYKLSVLPRSVPVCLPSRRVWVSPLLGMSSPLGIVNLPSFLWFMGACYVLNWLWPLSLLGCIQFTMSFSVSWFFVPDLEEPNLSMWSIRFQNVWNSSRLDTLKHKPTNPG